MTKKRPKMTMVETEYLEWAGKRATAFESIRNVARAAQTATNALAVEDDWMPELDDLVVAVDALPPWVLEES